MRKIWTFKLQSHVFLLLTFGSAYVQKNILKYCLVPKNHSTPFKSSIWKATLFVITTNLISRVRCFLTLTFEGQSTFT